MMPETAHEDAGVLAVDRVDRVDLIADSSGEATKGGVETMTYTCERALQQNPC